MASLEVEHPRSFSNHTSPHPTPGTLLLVAAGGEPTVADVGPPEEILYEAVHGREALHLGGRLEAPHLALALARQLMGDFSSIVAYWSVTWTTDGITARRADA